MQSLPYSQGVAQGSPASQGLPRSLVPQGCSQVSPEAPQDCLQSLGPQGRSYSLGSDASGELPAWLQELALSQRQPPGRPCRSIKPKLHHITHQLADPLEERRRRDAIRAKTNRDKRKAQMAELKARVAAYMEQYNALLAEVRALRLRSAQLTTTLHTLREHHAHHAHR
ncbi:uncharacterized protein LOC123518211 [Portunus trituberculatus]|uniref:uncharacterized protein LOC123518211 n=1 Tax=Portunus trituberculatus TaxID=210409 RepID=UPI001E1CC535|nr:uncharacterized protein LOC123518211 [Portunus trituberculatus]